MGVLLMNDQILSTLNDKQIEAVTKPIEPVLVIAGPGTGKTRLLVSRIAWLIKNENVNPDKILALTFTNKAAAEMKSRLTELIGQDTHDVYVGTFHSFALNLLRRYYELLELNPFFTVCDQTYQDQLVKKLCAPFIEENIDLKVKGILLSFSNFAMRGKKLSVFAEERYKEYQNHLHKHNLIDFDQIISFCLKLLQENQDICEEYSYLYPAILVDEFQDTDPFQYEILRLLSKEHKNIFVVADDDQSIYSWRGANPENIKNFIRDFSIKKPVFLEINYRNGDKIISNAYRVISQTDRIEPDKKQKVDIEKSSDIELKFFYHEKDEVEFILTKIQSWVTDKVPYSEIAVIYPFHKIGQSLEQYIIKKQIPYQMATGKSILDEPLVKRIILYLKFIRDAEDPISLEELARVELGESLYSLIKHIAQNQHSSFRKILYQFYREEDEKLPYDSLLRIRNFIAHIANLVNLKGFFKFSQLLDEIYLETDPRTHSILFKYRFKLEKLDFISESDDLNQEKLSEERLYVYHSDKRISFLAAILLKQVLNCNVETLGDEHAFSELSDKDLVIELDSTVGKGEYNVKRLPIYLMKNEKRQGSLSNLFKFLQWQTSHEDNKPFNKYVVLDLETTDKDKSTCGIVEIAAVRIENNIVLDELNSLINPEKAISKRAQRVHNISKEDVQDAPTIEEFWPKFHDFIGDSILIAHNGYNFDFPILDRYSKNISGIKLSNSRIDTLVIARNLFPGESNSIDALIQRFNLKVDKRHRALEDVQVLAQIMQKLQLLRLEIGRLTSLEMFLDNISLANFLEEKISGTEDKIFFIAGGRKLQSIYSMTRTLFAKEFRINEDILKEQIREKLYQLNPVFLSYQNNEHLLEKIKQLATQFDGVDFDEATANFLTQLSLNSSQDQLENINAVSLLTYHSAKGLEFDKVILMGMENKNMPGFHALRKDSDDDRPIPKKLEEQRRLFYVGMTRAKTELVLTAVKNRGGWEHESSPFLKDIKIKRNIDK
jgi:DNA polymerase III epsilon subunit family exonuclease